MKMKQKSLAATLYDYDVAPNNWNTTLEQNELKVPELVQEFKRMQQEHKVIGAERERLPKNNDELFRSEMHEFPIRST